LQLNDYSDLREAGTIDIPLNGQMYQAITDPPGAIVMAMTTTELDPNVLEKAGKEDGSIDESLLTVADKAGTLRAMQKQALKQLRFLDAVLTEDSAERWRYYFTELKDPAEGERPHTKKTIDDHRKHRITAAQMAAVTRDLVKVYSGGRPTEAPSSSSNGDGAGGPTSTAGAPAAT
jgi:hypothetical protein